MDRIKRYIDCSIPIETCNLRCHYCYIAQKRKFNNKIIAFEHSPDFIRKALSKERLGGVCLFNLCAGGETLLSDEILPIIKELLSEGHYVMIVTNGTLTKRFQEVALWQKELLSRLFFKFSYHFLEMIRMDMTEQFFSNVNLVKESGASFTVEITPSDELIPYIDEIKEVCMKHLGALCHVSIARDERTNGFVVLSDYDFDQYKNIWGVFKSDLFSFKSEIFYKKRHEFCYAGDWSGFLDLNSGVLKKCVYEEIIDNIYDNIDRPINFEAVGTKCSMPHCYNGHSYLTLGTIPTLNTPTYADIRNRMCDDGSEWLQPKMKAFMSTRLYDNNRQYGLTKKVRLMLPASNKFRGALAKTSFYQKLHEVKKFITQK